MRVVVGALIAALMLFALQRFVVAPWRCNSDIKKLRNETIEALQKDPATQVTLARSILAETEELIQNCEPNAESYMIKAANERALGLLDQAAETYRAALSVDRRPEIYANLADVELALGQQGEARLDYVRAARFNLGLLASIPDEEMRQEVLQELARTGDDRAFRFRRHHRRQQPQ